MASEFTKDPICLIENQKNQLTVNPEALEILDKISEPVVVVAIAGLYWTGKSYLINLLARQNRGFPLTSTVKSETKGIWMWCVPHPSKPNHTLILLDTVGLGDVDKVKCLQKTYHIGLPLTLSLYHFIVFGQHVPVTRTCSERVQGESKNDSWIFALAVLLSSMFVYNRMGTINHQALEQLHYMIELTKLIRAKSSPSSGGVPDSAEFVSFFPDFVWAVRDFVLEQKSDGRRITEDEYLEDSLKLIPGENPKIEKSNMPRESIRRFFPSRKCFVFDRPTNNKKLVWRLDEVSTNKLDSIFQKKSENFCEYIFTKAKTKTLREGIPVTGNDLGILARTYVDAINSGKVPCLENAVTTLAQIENTAAVQKAGDHYSQQMAQQVRFPTDTLQELLDLHAACERDAIKVFMDHSFKDDEREFQEKLLDTIEKKKNDFLRQNEDASAQCCQALIEKIAEPLMEDISGGVFSKQEGYQLFRGEMDKIVQSYNQANEVLQSFLQSQEATKESILQADKALTAAEKALAAEHHKLLKTELLGQKEKEQEEKLKAQEKSFIEHIAQLKEKMEKVMHTRLREQEEMLAHKLKEHKELLKEEFKEKSEEVNKEIRHLREQIEDINITWVSVLESFRSTPAGGLSGAPGGNTE